MRLFNMNGYKLFKEDEDGNIHVIRIVGMKRPKEITPKTPDPTEIVIRDYDTCGKRTVKVADLKDYSPLKPDGILTISLVNIRDSKNKAVKDVIVTATKFINLEYKINVMPYAVCRQNVTDIFYNLLAEDEEHTMVGLSVNQDTCPANFDFGIMFAADEVVYNEFINFYRTDLIEDLLDDIVKTNKYDEALHGLYEIHAKTAHRPEILMKKQDNGWCSDLRTLLKENNFQADVNQMLGITDVAFDIAPYIVEKHDNSSDMDYPVASDDLRYWLSSIFKINIKEIGIIEFDNDINLADFNDSRYLLIRDKSNTLYLMVYTLAGEYHEADLEAKAKEYDFVTKFKIEFYNKYNSINKE